MRHKSPQLVEQHCFVASFGSMFRVFHVSCVINLSRSKNIRCRLKTVVAKRRARVYFEQQILPLLLVFHQTRLVKFAHVARQVEGFCISYFRASRLRKIVTGLTETFGLNFHVALPVKKLLQSLIHRFHQHRISPQD